eukprot:260391_1
MHQILKSIKKRKSDGATALYIACRKGSLECVKYLLSNNGIFINETENEFGETPLSIASLTEYGHTDIVEMLISHSNRMKQQQIDHGILDVNKSNNEQFTALFNASQRGNAFIVKLLLQNGADPNQSNFQGGVPLCIAAQNGHVEVVRVLLSHSNTDIDYQTLTGDTPLYTACHQNHSEVVELLLHPTNLIDDEKEDNKQRKGANINLAKHDGCTPLWIASSKGNIECIELLIKYDAEIDTPDTTDGVTPLFAACQQGKKKAVELLLAANADINGARSSDGFTPIIMAAYEGHIDTVELLLKLDADPKKENTYGWDCFSAAAAGGHLELVKLIYKR